MDKRRACVVLTAVLALSSGYVQAQVVADDACPNHAVDIASYATCDGDKVASSNRFDLQQALLTERRVAPLKRTSPGLYVDAADAYRLKSADPQGVALVDVRSQLEVVLAGRASAVDIHVPYLEHTLYRNEDGRGWTIAENSGFLDELVQRLQRRNADIDTLIMVMCRSGERSAQVVDRLAELGYLLVVSVIDGFEGDLGSDGRRSVNGWKNAGLPWAADAQAIAGYVDVSLSN